ncbi:alpha/beta hydrolase fold [Amycolatopsis marina]|uniref:Alpha/beta hydrolase fold n=1 Tax=Amycolatopsis marina TaxID=490629 RepID=A0A1I1C1J6_9PSEU|nr:alpha/beta fold hydrolase [Amycolatopsis marina]SFB54433.1 alpha/beta hydrolase fold [Amycolatopsis marina]
MDRSVDELGERLRRQPGVTSVRRPAADGIEFDLTYVRTGPRADTPVLFIPGGPGLGAVYPYLRFRPLAAKYGLDTIMVEHRGVGLSRTDTAGADLPRAALNIDAVVADLAAVLDAEGIARAVVYGTSYGGYLAQSFAAAHPERVAGMVLDSTWSEAGEFELARSYVRELLWHGTDPVTAPLAERLRTLVDTGVVPVEETGDVVPVAYDLGGADLLRRLLDAAERGRLGTWNWLAGLGNAELHETKRYLMEFDLVGVINFRDLYPLRPDGLPMDQAAAFGKIAGRFPPFAGEPRHLPDELPHFDWPTAVLSGRRDMRMVRPVLRRMAERIPGAVLLPFDDVAHSVFDTRPRAAIHIAGAMAAGNQRLLPGLLPRIEALARPTMRALLPKALEARLRLERLTGKVPRAGTRG